MQGALIKAAMEASSRLSLSVPIIIKTGTAAMPVAVPMTFGVVYPVVLMPAEAASWPAERLRVVFLHEAAHVKRLDWMTTMLTQVVCALYWFHPLVWLAARRLRVESEQACDDLVLGNGVEAVEYADHLVEVVRGLAGRRVSSAVVTMAYSQEVTGRLKTILAGSKNRTAATSSGFAFATLTALTLVLPLAAMRPVGMHPNVRQHQGTAVQENAPWRVSLPDGTTARLLSVTAGDPAMGQKPSSRTFTVGFSFPSAQIRQESHISLYVSDDPGRTSGARRPIGDREAQVETSYDFPPDQKQVDLTLPIAVGPYRTLVTGTFPAGGSQQLATGETVTLSRAVSSLTPVRNEKVAVVQVMVTVPLRFVSAPYEYGLDLLGREGQPLHITHSGANIPNPAQKTAHILCTYRAAELPAGGVSGFRFRCRLVHTFVLHHVGLQPRVLITQTSPQPLPAVSKPFDFDQTTWAQTAGDAGLKLVAVSDKPANTKRWWRPDGTPFLYDWHQFHVNFEPQNPHVPHAFVQQTPVLIFRSGHPSTSDFSIDGWRDPQAFRPNAHVTLAEYVCIDQNGTSYFGFTPLLASNSRSISVRMRVGAGPWQVQDTREMAYAPAWLAKDVRQMIGGSAAASWTARPVSSTRTEIRLQQPKGIISGRQVRLVALDSHGHEYAPKPGTTTDTDKGSGPVTDYTLAVPLSRIRKFLVEVRPYYYRDFYGIARQPVSLAQHASPGLLAPVLLLSMPSSPTPLSLTPPLAEAQKEQAASAANLHLIGLALAQYIGDHDKRFPDAAHWMDQIIPYLVPAQVKGAERQQRIAAIFHDPTSPPNQTWSYAYNRALSGLSATEIDNPNQVVAVFEGSQGTRNASDGGQSVPQPGRHSGGSDFLFADGHTKFLRAEDTPLLIAKLNPPVIDSSGNLIHLNQPQNMTGWFAPVNPDARQKIPIQGLVFDRRTMKPLSSTFVIFSQSPKKITVGSVWPSSFTNKAGRFQSILYPGKNYLMVLENNRFRFVGKTLMYKANGNKGSVSTQGTKGGPLRSAQSDYTIHLSLPRAYALKMSSALNNDPTQDIVTFVPVTRSASR